jgi:hypothetical protein
MPPKALPPVPVLPPALLLVPELAVELLVVEPVLEPGVALLLAPVPPAGSAVTGGGASAHAASRATRNSSRTSTQRRMASPLLAPEGV